MSRETKIEWTDHTFNPWIGCSKVSAGCTHCYAAESTFTRVQRSKGRELWGVDAERHVRSDAAWREPLKWNADAAEAGERRRVFCASLADVFEDHVVAEAQRPRLWALIDKTPWLDWLLLTKRPENIRRMVPRWSLESPRPNVWMGTTVENREMADKRIPLLGDVPAVVRFISAEPLLGELDLWRHLEIAREVDHPERGWIRSGWKPEIDWVIVGGESGARARPFKAAWARLIVEQCKAAGLPVFVKQLGAHILDRNDIGFQGGMGDEFVNKWPSHLVAGDRIEDNPNGYREEYQGAPVRIRLRNKKGGDPWEWPSDLRVREFPKARTT